MTPLPFSPFLDVSRIDPNNRFVLDEQRFLEEIMDGPPLFIGSPSEDFIAACHRDLLPIIETYARRG